MASPQTENGYTKIANELLEAICRRRFRGSEYGVVLWIARLSYGWSARKTKTVTIWAMADAMNKPYSSIKLAVSVLLESGVLLRDKKGRFSINKDYDTWAKVASPLATLASPLATLASPLATLASPLATTGQPVGQLHDEPKEMKEIERNRNTAQSAESSLTVKVEGKPLTPIQAVIRAYKVAKKIPPDDAGWDKANFAIYARAAKKLLDAFDGQDKRAVVYLLGKVNSWADATFSWNLATIAKMAWDDRGGSCRD